MDQADAQFNFVLGQVMCSLDILSFTVGCLSIFCWIVVICNNRFNIFNTPIPIFIISY